jgi:hypothetical protein
MPYTRRDLVDQALRDLGVLPANATPSAADVATVDAKVDGVIRRLERLEIVSIPDDDDIDPEVFHPVALFVADAAKSEFGGAQIDVASAEALLRRITRVGPDYSVQDGQFF